MGRFLAIVIALVIVALVINNWQSKRRAAAEKGDHAAVVAPNEDPPNEISPKKLAEYSGKLDTAVEGASPKKLDTVDGKLKKLLHNRDTKGELATDDAKPSSPEAEAPKVKEEPTAEVASANPKPTPKPEPKSESTPSTEPETKPSTDPKPKSQPETSAPPKPSTEPENVKLGDGALLGGIPGEGDLTMEQIETWLGDPKNHAVLLPELPLGLEAGASAIAGIEENPLTRAKIELGRQLYFDTRLSVDDTISCASCHDPEHGYAKDTRFGVGVKKQEGNRNSPVAYNRIVSSAQFWDGRAASLEDQAIGPMANPIEMGNTHEVVMQTISGVPGYQKQFTAIFEDGETIENAGKAIASFERTLVTGPAPWDHYQELKNFERAYAADIEDLDALQEEDEELYNDYMELKKASEANPISESAVRGGELFFSDKAGCTACHVGANFTDEKYHNLGVGMDADEPDLGRYEVTKEDVERGAFKTPTVRNIAQTGPYMHDGSQETLEEVVEWYVKGGHPNPHLSEKVKKLDLTDQDKADLVAFMKEGLTGSLPPVETGRLPK
ncbi:cytochrome c peroxidase [Bythopirellula goksoeyrii]|uniref:Cytochrome c551 peroxidase n=1 Tax=Bythopirellula goksoeyrii TaxID=1400387 RepID=A0A5B9QUL7_9BACT|nr:cytochrome c peroxidase [Bythopirellula goksoeyrii]QEG37761.1 Cytochrome c551 peroxidase precursor [Bythopirellula goksoeyrii]